MEEKKMITLALTWAKKKILSVLGIKSFVQNKVFYI